MSKRLQVLMDEQEWSELEAAASRHGQTVSEWVRQALRAAWRSESTGSSAKKLQAIRTAARHDLPTADIDEMLRQIASGYGDLPE